MHQVVERLELSAFEQGYVEEGRPAYHPAAFAEGVAVAYALGVTSARRLEQRVRRTWRSVIWRPERGRTFGR